MDWDGKYIENGGPLRTSFLGIKLPFSFPHFLERAFEKKSLSAPMIFDEMHVFAQLISASLPSESTRMARVSSMYLHAYKTMHDEMLRLAACMHEMVKTDCSGFQQVAKHSQWRH